LPLVGATIGALAGGIALAAARIVPHPLAAALALALSVALSGAIHLDGFLDGCDAFFASVSPARRREILKDPHHGTFALAGLLAAGSVWYAALVVLPAERYPAVLAFAGALSRAAVLPSALLLPAAGGGAASAPAPRVELVLVALELLALAVAGTFLTVTALVAVPLTVVAAALGARWIASLLGGGLVGDAHGFAIVVLEIAILAALGSTFAAG